MVRDGYYFLIPILGAATLAYLATLPFLTVLLILCGAFVAFFFRDPERQIPADPRAIVSPADGKVIRLQETEAGYKKLVIFLSVFDVHVNRAPIEGRIVEQKYQPGRFRLAFDDRASVENEQLILTLAGKRSLTFSLIAGLLARRIVAWKRKGDAVAKGDRIGLIRFGSRVDVFLPRDCRLAVKEGDRVKGGSSIIAYWSEG